MLHRHFLLLSHPGKANDRCLCGLSSRTAVEIVAWRKLLAGRRSAGVYFEVVGRSAVSVMVCRSQVELVWAGSYSMVEVVMHTRREGTRLHASSPDSLPTTV